MSIIRHPIGMMYVVDAMLDVGGSRPEPAKC